MLNINEIVKSFKNCKNIKQLHDAIHKPIVMMGEISGGVIKMSDIFGVNETNRIENYEVRFLNRVHLWS